MAVKSSGQVTIIDITDGYTVGQTNESWTIPSTTDAAIKDSQTTTNIYVFRGSEPVSNFTVGEITATSSSGANITSQFTINKTQSPKITITVKTANSLKTGGIIKIPVSFAHTDGENLTFEKELSFSLALKGTTGAQGPQGAAGNDSIAINILASPGTIFRKTTETITLTAYVYKGGEQLSDFSSLGKLKWYKGTPSSSTYIDNSEGQNSITISGTEVASIQAYTCQLEGA